MIYVKHISGFYVDGQWYNVKFKSRRVASNEQTGLADYFDDIVR